VRPVIECEHVRKCYGEIRAVDDVDLTIAAGEVFGLVGPNGAGKTTLIEMIESLRTPDGGSIRVLGLDPVRQADELQEKIGIQLQTTSIQPNITVMEAVSLFGGFYRRAAADPGALLKTLSLEDKSGSRFRKLSGGQQQRVAIALALVNDPEVLFLDELTTGLDPQAPTNMWELVKDIKSRGRTIFLTTHYMEEAEELKLDLRDPMMLFWSVGFPALFAVGSAARTSRTANIIIWAAFTPMLMLSELFLPISILPAWLQPVARALPLTPVNTLLRDIVYGGALDDLWRFGVLAAWTVAASVVTVRFFKWE